jgi:ATP-dependent Lon protease
MTGEITMTGQVLPIGGIREKSLAAQRAGLKRVIMPRDNEPDLAELPTETKRELEFILVDTIDEVFEAAFNGNAPARATPVPVTERAAAQPSVNVASSRSHASVSPPRS